MCRRRVQRLWLFYENGFDPFHFFQLSERKMVEVPVGNQSPRIESLHYISSVTLQFCCGITAALQLQTTLQLSLSSCVLSYMCNVACMLVRINDMGTCTWRCVFADRTVSMYKLYVCLCLSVFLLPFLVCLPILLWRLQPRFLYRP